MPLIPRRLAVLVTCVMMVAACSAPSSSITAAQRPAPAPSPFLPTATASPVPASTATAPAAGPKTKPTPKVTARSTTTHTAPSGPQWTYAPNGPTFGNAGTVRRYRVAVEAGVGTSAAAFASEVNSTLADPRSWIAGNNVRFHQVSAANATDFTIWLASPATAQRLCAASGVNIVVGAVPYTSCRGGNNVVINSARYFNAVPGYGASLAVYRNYAINHEVGHWLGHGHQLCPGTGQPAPVMQQQTLGLKGCVANGWPYLNGKLYSGPPTGG